MEEVERIIKEIKGCAEDVYSELGGDWPEKIYQKAMEISLRLKGIDYESQRSLSINYKGYFVGEGIPDFIVWINEGRKRIAVIVELKQDRNIKEDYKKQVIKYLDALRKQVKGNEEVYNKGLILNFPTTGGGKVERGEIEEVGKVEVFPVEFQLMKSKAYLEWTEEEDTRLKDEYFQGKTINELTNIFQRQPGAILSHLRKLGLKGN